ncbi:MAG: microcin C ABC transporter permease YejB [Candidatus Pacebacteria bacterium]|nr:microcin C ABC transporter permease YejB [Candidatus Paceibacterota bacterium]
MITYILRRLFLIIPTLVGIITLNFFIVQAAPGGPVDRTIAMIRGSSQSAEMRFNGSGGDMIAASNGTDMASRGLRGLRPELVEEIKKSYGFDKPLYIRYFTMLKSYASFDLGKSFYSDRRVIDLIISKLPVSISLGLWTVLIIYGVSIPLGIYKARNDGSRTDIVSSFLIIIGYAIPGFLIAILLIVLFAGGSFLSIFPLRGIVSEGWQSLTWYHQIVDYLWHLVLPILSMILGGFASLTLLTKNSFIDELSKLYVTTARAKGLSAKQILYNHVFRNASLLLVSGFPAALLAIFFTSSLLTEVIFSLDGLGLLSFESAINRDYPVLFGSLYIFTLLGLLLSLLGDIVYMVIDPRIDFNSRRVG